MKSLYLRVWLTVVAALALFALVSGWLVQRHLDGVIARQETLASERLAAWGDLVQRSLPPAGAPVELQADALLEWSQRMHVPLALDDARGTRVATSASYERRAAAASGESARAFSIRLDDGRTLWIMRPPLRAPRTEGLFSIGPKPDGLQMTGPRPEGLRFGGIPGGPTFPGDSGPFVPPGWARGTGLVVVLVLLFVAVAAGAVPVVRRLTRRLEALKQGVERFGAGALHHRVDASGKDEVAAVAASFNRAAERVETLVRSHRSLLANASHELRSPLARLKMAVEMLDSAPPARRPALRSEIDANIGELDALVEEVLMASRLEGQAQLASDEVELLSLAVEEASRVGAEVNADGTGFAVLGDERLLRRALRNLLENARRYGGESVHVELLRTAGERIQVRVCDRGPGVPEAMRERIFEPFFRLPGHAEREGGVGLGLSLVRQIVERHGGSVVCMSREGGGSCFLIELDGVRAAASDAPAPAIERPANGRNPGRRGAVQQ